MSELQKIYKQIKVFFSLLQSSKPVKVALEGGNEHWRENFFFAVFFSTVMLGMVVYLQTLRVILNYGHWVQIVLYTILSLGLVIITFFHRIPFRIRIYFGLAIFYLLALVSLIFVGPSGSGRLWLYTLSITASILLGIRFGLLTLIFNAITVYAISMLLANGTLPWNVHILVPELWATTNITFIVINTISTLSIAILVRNLETSLENEAEIALRQEKLNAELQREIREREKNEYFLRESELRHRSFIDNINLGVAILAEDFTILMANDALGKLFRVTPHRLIGKKCYSHLYGRDSVCDACPIREVMKTNKPHEMEISLFSEEQVPLIANLKAFPNFASDGTINGYIELVEDITEKKQAEMTMYRSEMKFRTIVESISIGMQIYTLDAKKRLIITDANPMSERLLKISNEKLIGKEVSEALPALRGTEILEHIQKIAEHGGSWHTDSFRRDDRKLIQIFDVTLFQTTPGTVVVAFMDVTHKKQAEHLYKIQHELGLELSSVRDLYDACHLVLFHLLRLEGLDCGGIYLIEPRSGAFNIVTHQGLSKEFIEKTAYFDASSASARIVNEGIPLYITPADEMGDLEEVRKKEGIKTLAIVPVSYEHRVIASLNIGSRKLNEFHDDIKHTIEVTTQVLGEVITRIRAENLLRYSEKKYRTIFENTGTAMTILEEDTTISLCNSRFEELSGYAKEEIEGKKSWKEFVHPSEISRMAKFHDARRIDEMEAPRSYEFLFVDKEGMTKNIFITISMIAHSKQSVASLIDVTDEKRYVREIRSLNEDLERRVAERTIELSAVNRELEAFTYSVSHDLRAPLRRIMGFSQALIEDSASTLDEQGHDYLTRIFTASENMNNLIDDLLKLSRLTTDELHREIVGLSEMAAETVRDLSLSEPERQIEIDVFPNIIAYGDKRLLRIVLENLLENAWKFSKKEKVTKIVVGTEVEHPLLKKGDGQRTYFVRDNGIGFDMKYAQKIFGVFQRFHKDSDFEGTGIGLATVQRIITRHGGRVWAESERGKGTSLYFSLPVPKQ